MCVLLVTFLPVGMVVVPQSHNLMCVNNAK